MAIKFLNTVAVDTDVLYVDASSNRVGIGTTSPSEKLEVAGAIKMSQNASYPLTIKHNSSTSTNQIDAVGGLDVICSNNNVISFKDATTTNMTISGYSGDVIMGYNAGKVGIGTTSPADKLTVQNGNIRLNTTNSSVSQGLFARSNNSSPPMGGISWNQNPGFIGSEWYHYKQTSPYTQARIRLIGDASSGGMFVNLNGSDVFTIKTSSGNVGIGTTSPNHELVVQGTSSPNIELKNSNYSNGGFILNRTNYGHQWKWWAESNVMYFGFSTDESTYSTKLAIESSGDVGIGTTSPQKKLHVSSGDQSTARIRLSNTNTASGGDNIELVAGVHNVTQDGFSIYNASGGGTQFVIQGGGNVGIGTDSPSAKLEVEQSNSSTNTVFLSNSYNNKGFRTGNSGYATFSGYQDSNNTVSGSAYGALIGLNTFYNGTNFYNDNQYVDPSSILFKDGSILLHTNDISATGNFTPSERLRITKTGNVGIGTTSPNQKLEVNGAVKAVDGYKGYVSHFHSGGFDHFPRSGDAANPMWIPTNYIVDASTDQYYNVWVPLYAGRIRKIILKNITGTPTATVCTFRKKINGVLSGTTYAGTVTGGGAAGMKVTFDFGTTNFTFNAEDEVQIGIVTGVAQQPPMRGVSYQIWYEYNIT